MILNRRSLILGAASLLAAPAIVRAESLMKIVAPQSDIWLISWGPSSVHTIRSYIEYSSDEIVWHRRPTGQMFNLPRGDEARFIRFGLA